MPKRSIQVEVRLVFTNHRALRALYAVMNCLDDIATDFEYRADLRKAVRAAKYVMRHIDVVKDTE